MPFRPTLLCVDDEPSALEVLSRTFSGLGEVITARSGREALEILRTRRVDLLLTDQKLPEMTGIELVRQARAEGLDVTTILLTAETNPTDLIAAIDEGRVFRSVTRPFDLQDLTLTVRNALALVELRREKEALLRDLTDARQLAQRKDDFVGMVSHELRTPLTSITGALDLVLNHITGDLNEKQRRFLEMARESTDRLNVLVDDLLDLAKFEKGRMKMAFERVHLDDLVRAAAEKYGPAMAERGLMLRLDVPAEGVRLLADPARVTQVLNNLLTNAVKFTPVGGQVSLSVVRASAVPGSAALTVWSSGPPIPEGDLDRIFDRFEQARTDANRKVPGTGLGLSICRSILQAHGGHIWAEPDTTGARFVAVFPDEPPAILDTPRQPLATGGTGAGGGG